MPNEPENLVIELLRGIRRAMATKAELAELKADMHSLCAAFASDFLTFRKEFGEQIVGLRRAVME
jgi:hypothetical protein